jgi:lipid II:glycine glycyltransferase (peptidoglycan interpeptide bridge formation enzyme)
MLQGRAWARFQEALGRKVIYDTGSDWSWMGALRRGRGVKYLMVSYGPTLGSTADFSEVTASLLEAAHKLKLDFVRIEPVGKITIDKLLGKEAIRFGDIQPSRTWVLDLEPTLDELRSGMSSGHRNAVNGADRRGLKFRVSEDPKEIEEFIAMLQAIKSRTFRPHPPLYFRKLVEALIPVGAAKLYFMEAEGTLVAGSLGLDFGTTRYYAHAASQPEARNLQAAVPLVWNMIVNAKENGLKHFDFWGVAPAEDPHHPWSGFSQFKRSFGGREVETMGTWDLPQKKTKYSIYRLAKKVL